MCHLLSFEFKYITELVFLNLENVTVLKRSDL